ncbi:MAG: cytochrome c oxidase subunit II, partial [Gammaproteobacteria bacterium]|nr:cytochrome c oxidase subunit II [Gammaproteobacteria bacterium]
MKAFMKLAAAGVAGLCAVTGAANAAWELNMPVGVTEISNTVYDLHMLILWICVVIGIAVFGAMIYSIVNHRKSKGAVAAEFHESTTVEIAWTVVPFIILVGMAVPAAKTLVVMEQTGDSDLTVKVTGYQWKWRYE